jgi:hypothetical protein
MKIIVCIGLVLITNFCQGMNPKPIQIIHSSNEIFCLYANGSILRVGYEHTDYYGELNDPGWGEDDIQILSSSKAMKLYNALKKEIPDKATSQKKSDLHDEKKSS